MWLLSCIWLLARFQQLSVREQFRPSFSQVLSAWEKKEGGREGEGERGREWESLSLSPSLLSLPPSLPSLPLSPPLSVFPSFCFATGKNSVWKHWCLARVSPLGMKAHAGKGGRGSSIVSVTREVHSYVSAMDICSGIKLLEEFSSLLTYLE